MTRKKWTVRAYEAGDEEGILKLFNEVFSEVNPQFVHRTMEEWTWQFRDSPLGNQTSVAVDTDGRIIGQYTSIPNRTWLRGKEEVTSQIVDSCVAAEYRRSLKREGVFLTVATLYFDIFAYGHPTVLCYGYPIPNAQRIGVRFLGYVPVQEPTQQLALEVDGNRIKTLEERGKGVELEQVMRFDGRTDAFWSRLKEKIGYTLVRDHLFLNWRYDMHPRVEYQCYHALRGEEVVGILVYRIGWIDQKITPVLELFTDPEDEAAQCALAAQAARHALEAAHPRLEMWLPPNGAWYKPFPALGFVQEPTRFNLINRLFADWMTEDWLMANYYFTMGDSDIY